jgi:hypothetical protein
VTSERRILGRMTEPTYDAIVGGARCAGAPTSMLLAHRGYHVLLVDHAYSRTICPDMPPAIPTALNRSP